MKKFYLKNMKLIHKFLLNQIVISIFGMMTIIPLSEFGKSSMLAATLISTLFFMFLLYDAAWDEGGRDRNRVCNNRLEYRPLHGVKIALFAYIPTFIFLVPVFAGAALNRFGWHRLDDLFAVLKTILLFLFNGMYLGFSFLFGQNVFFPLILAAYIMPAALAYGAGYFLGLKDRRFRALFGIKPEK